MQLNALLHTLVAATTHNAQLGDVRIKNLHTNKQQESYTLVSYCLYGAYLLILAALLRAAS
jgi:hypothetical protein